ncbi:MAG: cysteine--tRNA ligase [Firmicutes bacterium]|nr:cysteine--tRNA ligase [Bacillota bacterium]
MRVQNTLSGRKEEFHPRDPGRVSIYVCGVTPYSDTHVGHARPSIFWDVVRRFLRTKGYRVLLVQNFTDVDDKIIARSVREGVPAVELARRFSEEYLEAMDLLAVERADVYPRVSGHIPAIIEVVGGLVSEGHAYVLDGDVYYDVSKFPSYGKLSKQRLEDLESGARVEVDERKRSPLDFALWKAAKSGEPAWDSPWGKGRPGWHIECSAMSLKYLGDGFDFHGGGVDLIFPHHENEMAQSEAYTGRIPFVRYWLHNGLLNMSKEKMSKSLGNFVTVKDLTRRFPAQAIRVFMLSTHYRSPIDFDEARLEEAARGWQRLEETRGSLRHFLEASGRGPDEFPGGEAVLLVSESEAGECLGSTPEEKEFEAFLHQTTDKFISGMEDDFNTAIALASLFELCRRANAFRDWLSPQVSVPGTSVTLLGRALGLLEGLGAGVLGVISEQERGGSGGLRQGPGPGSSAQTVMEPAGPGGPPHESGSPSGDGAATLAGRLVKVMVEMRQEARRLKDWAAADLIRDRLAEAGVLLEDTPQGTRWKLDSRSAGRGI